MLAPFLYFFPGHRLLATATSAIRTLFSCLSWVYSLFILRLSVSWAAREPGYWMSMQLFYSVTVDGELEVLVHNPAFGFFLAWTTFPASSRVSDPEIPAWWLDQMAAWLTKPSLWRTDPRELQSGFQRAGLGLATLLSTVGHGYSYSAAAATHTGECELDRSLSDSVLLFIFSCVKKLSFSINTINQWFVLNCMYLNSNSSNGLEDGHKKVKLYSS